ncbi:MAG: PilZ domain-containing protein [Magnetococcales bacterium]|nr:PilZ domain-containing protein [Magnetococcales bacterium]
MTTTGSQTPRKPLTPADNLDNRRGHQRRSSRSRGMLIHEGLGYPVSLVDISLKGFGILSKTQPIMPGEMVTLELSGEYGANAFSCFVVYCKEQMDGFLIGLSVYSPIPI